VELYPPLPALARENRAFVIKAAGWAARQRIGQFIDLGAGLPVYPSVCQAARAVLPAARVAYVDIDPVVLSHAAALLATGDGVAAVDADLRDPAAVLGHQDLRAVIDRGRPVCVILGAVLHFLGPQAARAVTAGTCWPAWAASPSSPSGQAARPPDQDVIAGCGYAREIL